MNRLRLSLAGYDALATALAVALDETISDEAERWLRDEVCPVCRELSRSGVFRLAARWSVDHLEPGVKTRERRLVEATDAAIIHLAKELAAASFSEDADPQAEHVAMPTETYQTLRWIAGRPWYDLVSPEEYFHAQRGLHLRTSNSQHARRFDELQELRVPLGDYVTRSMFARIDYWSALLDSSWNRIFVDAACPYAIQERLIAAKTSLDASIEQLRSDCFSASDPRFREAATTLTQVYVAYSPSPQLDWLGCPSGWASAEPALIRSVVRRGAEIPLMPLTVSDQVSRRQARPASLCDPTVLRHIASALNDASAFYGARTDSDDLVEWTKDRARLLLVDRSPREVYWEGVAVAPDRWDVSTNEWNLLWMLARHANRVVDRDMLIKPQGEAIRSRRSRLARLLIDSAGQLEAAIETVLRQGYRLNLAEDAVVLLRDDGTDRLVPEGATGPACL